LAALGHFPFPKKTAAKILANPDRGVQAAPRSIPVPVGMG
jgi:hypothetical protein